jgi:hypothetical protein
VVELVSFVACKSSQYDGIWPYMFRVTGMELDRCSVTDKSESDGLLGVVYLTMLFQ